MLKAGDSICVKMVSAQKESPEVLARFLLLFKLFKNMRMPALS